MTDPGALRCSDADREEIAERLRRAAGDGRLTLGELEQRLEAAYAARTYADLAPITTDLPAAQSASADGRRRPRSEAPRAEPERISAVFSGESRSGRWEVPDYLEVVAWMGSCSLDLTQAIVRHRHVVIDARLYFSGLTVVVPEGVDVRVEPGGTFLGDRSIRTAGRVTQGAPVVRIRGRVVLSSLSVRTPGRFSAALRNLFG